MQFFKYLKKIADQQERSATLVAQQLEAMEEAATLAGQQAEVLSEAKDLLVEIRNEHVRFNHLNSEMIHQMSRLLSIRIDTEQSTMENPPPKPTENDALF